MDYKDFTHGATENFWFKGKTGLIDILFQRVKTERGLKILDVGAGTGEDIPVMSRYGLVYAIDSDSQAVKVIPEKLIAKKSIGDATHLPYQDNFFDVVVAFDVIEHIQDDNAVVKEIRRVLKPQGVFLFTVPAMNLLFGPHDQALRHFRRYNKKSVGKLFQDGFKKIDIGYWMFFLFSIAAIRRLLVRSKKPKVDYIPLPKFINSILYKILSLENGLIKRGFKFPWGLTVFGIFRKI